MTIKKLDPLNQLITIDTTMRNYGFEWKTYQPIIEQITSEIREVTEALDNQESDQRIQEELGDLLHATICLTMFMNYDPETILTTTANKLEHRFALLQKIAAEHGYTTLKNQSPDLLKAFWNEAKKRSLS